MNWLVYILVGKLFIYLGMQFPLPKFLESYNTIKKWHECDLCFGVWVYSILAFILKVDTLSFVGLFYIPFISDVITGGLISFIVHIFSIGWRDKFSPDIVV